MNIVYLKYRNISFSLPGNLMDFVKKGIVGYVLEKMDEGQGFTSARPHTALTVFILIYIQSRLRNLHTDTVTR